MALARRWPSIPWVSKHIVVRETPDGTSIRRVFGSQSDPIASSELAQSTLPITLVLQEHQVLHQILPLPPVAASDLPTLLSHEVSRHTPFSAEQVNFTWQRLIEDKESSSQRVVLWILPLTQWQSLIARFGLDASRITRVDVADAKGQVIGINLLPKPLQINQWKPRIKAVALLLFVLTVLVVFSLVRILHNREADVARWQAQVTSLEQEVRPVRQLKASLIHKVKMQELWASLHRQSPSRVLILEELTQTLPRETVLDRLVIAGSDITIDGMTPSPEVLIPSLARAKTLKSPRLVGTLQADSTSGLMRFSVQAKLSGKDTP